MAFALDVTLQGYEYRGQQSGISQKTGNPWLSLIVEGGNARQVNVSVPSELQAEVQALGLKRGDCCDFPVAAVASAKSSFVLLRGLPVRADDFGL